MCNSSADRGSPNSAVTAVVITLAVVTETASVSLPHMGHQPRLATDPRMRTLRSLRSVISNFALEFKVNRVFLCSRFPC